MNNTKFVRFAVVGVAGIAHLHIKAINELPEAKLVTVCDIVESHAKEWAEKEHLERYYTDYDKMLADGGFDCVVLCTPDMFHAEECIKALNAGYHVMCEKPLTQTYEECAAIVEASKKSDRKFMVGQVCRKAPGFVKAKELIESGLIGNLFYVESEYAHDYSLIQGADWRRDPSYPRHGIVGGGIHAMDLLRWIAGNPEEIFAYSNHKVLTDWPVDDCTVSVLKYPNGVIGKVFCSIGCKRNYTMRTVLYGDKGTIIVDNTTPELTYFDTLDEPKHPERKIPIELKSHNMTAEIQDMCRFILEDAPVDCDAVQGANSVVACLAAVESSKTGLPVKPRYFR